MAQFKVSNSVPLVNWNSHGKSQCLLCKSPEKRHSLGLVSWLFLLGHPHLNTFACRWSSYGCGLVIPLHGHMNPGCSTMARWHVPWFFHGCSMVLVYGILWLIFKHHRIDWSPLAETTSSDYLICRYQPIKNNTWEIHVDSYLSLPPRSWNMNKEHRTPTKTQL